MIDKIVEVKVETKLKASYRINAAPCVDPEVRDWSEGKMAHDLGCKLADYITSKDPGTDFSSATRETQSDLKITTQQK